MTALASPAGCQPLLATCSRAVQTARRSEAARAPAPSAAELYAVGRPARLPDQPDRVWLALRAPVIHRKVSLGTQSQTGERFAERALSAAGLPTATPLAVRLSQRTHRCPQPRRSLPRPRRLRPLGLNAYRFQAIGCGSDAMALALKWSVTVRARDWFQHEHFTGRGRCGYRFMEPITLRPASSSINVASRFQWPFRGGYQLSSVWLARVAGNPIEAALAIGGRRIAGEVPEVPAQVRRLPPCPCGTLATGRLGRPG
jgi:hypothetical protein